MSQVFDAPPRTAHVLLAVVGALVVVAAVRLAPIQDETYYWAWARSPSWSYVDHPPGVAWILAAAQHTLGLGLAGLRAPALAAMAATALLTARTAARLTDAGPSSLATSGARRRTGVLALLVLVGAPMFAIGYVPATPDPFQGALSALAAALVVGALAGSAPSAFFAGLVLVASVLSKHSSGVLALGALGGALAVPEGRRVLARPHVWAGVLCGLVAISPWISADLFSINGSVRFQHTRVVTRGEPRGLLAIPVLAGGLVVALGPAGVLALATTWPRRALGGAALDPGLARAAAIVLGAGAWLLVASCLVPVWLGGGELNWSMPALVFALPASAALVAARGGPLERTTRGLAMVSTAVVLVLLAHVAAPFLPLRASKDTTLRGAGFDGLAAQAKTEAARSGARAIATRRYQLASELRFHLADALPVLELGGARPSQYDVWTKPALCRGDVVLTVLAGDALPPEVAGAVVGERTTFERIARGEVLDRWWLTPLRLERDLDPARCPASGGRS